MEITTIYSNPSKYNLAPYGAICNHGEKLFIQVSKDPEIAQWIELGKFLEKALIKEITTKEFLDSLLKKYERNNE